MSDKFFGKKAATVSTKILLIALLSFIFATKKCMSFQEQYDNICPFSINGLSGGNKEVILYQAANMGIMNNAGKGVGYAVY
nr:hypothetical protein [Bacillus infantis]